MPVLLKFYARKQRQEIRHPLRAAFRGAVRENNGTLAMSIVDLEKKFRGGNAIGWSYGMCLAYSVYKRSYNVANRLLRRFRAVRKFLSMGPGDNEHYYTHVLSNMACRGDISGFKWLMRWVKPEDFPDDVVEDAYGCCRGPRGKAFAILMKAKFDVLEDYDVDAHFAREEDAADAPPTDSETDIDTDGSEAEFE